MYTKHVECGCDIRDKRPMNICDCGRVKNVQTDVEWTLVTNRQSRSDKVFF